MDTILNCEEGIYSDCDKQQIINVSGPTPSPQTSNQADIMFGDQANLMFSETNNFDDLMLSSPFPGTPFPVLEEKWYSTENAIYVIPSSGESLQSSTIANEIGLNNWSYTSTEAEESLWQMLSPASNDSKQFEECSRLVDRQISSGPTPSQSITPSTTGIEVGHLEVGGSHKEVERKRRCAINTHSLALAEEIPSDFMFKMFKNAKNFRKSASGSRDWTQAMILQGAKEYIMHLKRENEKLNRMKRGKYHIENGELVFKLPEN